MPPANRLPPRQMGTSVGIPLTRPDRTAPSIMTNPNSVPGASDTTTDITTYFTKVGVASGKQTPILYNGDRRWANVTLTLETAGPVAVGNRADLLPVLGGKGQLLQTGVPLTFIIGKGTRLYVVASAVSRVKVQIAPLPWLEDISSNVASILAGINSLVARGGR